MKDRSGVYAVIAVLSFILMAVSLAWAYANADEGGVGLAELGPSIGLGLLFLVNLVLSKQSGRR